MGGNGWCSFFFSFFFFSFPFFFRDWMHRLSCELVIAGQQQMQADAVAEAERASTLVPGTSQAPPPAADPDPAHRAPPHSF
jgi:hypothetical protein